MFSNLRCRRPRGRGGRTDLLFALLLASAGCQEVSSPDLGSKVLPPRQAAVSATPQVAAGGFHTCTLRTTGVIQCWGNNVAGQAPASRSATSSSFKGIGVGFAHTCGVRNDGIIECFGLNTSGQAPAQQLASTGTFTQVAVGGTPIDYSCGLRSDGAFECWGTNASGFAPAVRTAATGTFTQVSISNGQECARRSDGAVECWDFNSVLLHHVTTAASGTFTQVATGTAHVCALSTLGHVECWGSNNFLQAPASWTAGAGTFTAVSAGFQHSCALRTDGVIECKGDNSTGAAPATRVATGGTYTQVSAGYQHTCGQVSSGLVECWGLNADGQAKSEQRITFTSSAHAVQVGASFSVAATASSGAAVTFSSLSSGVCTVATATVTVVAEGSCIVAADQAGTATYVAAPQITQTTFFVAAPTNVLTTSPAPNTIDVNWTDASSVETKFNVQRRIRNGDGSWGSWLLVATRPPNAVTYHDATVSTGLSYMYRVQACQQLLCSAWSAGPALLLETIPSAPSNLSATPTPPVIDLAWTDASTNETRIEVLKRTQKIDFTWGDWLLIITLPANSSSYRDPAASQTRPVQYRIRTCNIAGCSAWVTSLALTVQQPPAAPSGMVASAASSSPVDLLWSDNSNNETQFELQQRVRTGKTWGAWVFRSFLPANQTFASDFASTAATTYTYRIRACNAVGCSAWATSNNVTTP